MTAILRALLLSVSYAGLASAQSQPSLDLRKVAGITRDELAGALKELGIEDGE